MPTNLPEINFIKNQYLFPSRNIGFGHANARAGVWQPRTTGFRHGRYEPYNLSGDDDEKFRGLGKRKYNRPTDSLAARPNIEAVLR